MDTAPLISICVGASIIGFVVGRWYERYRIYKRLLASNDPENWTAAHRLEKPERESHSEDSDVYAPTPTKLSALIPTKKLTEKGKGDEDKAV